MLHIILTAHRQTQNGEEPKKKKKTRGVAEFAEAVQEPTQAESVEATPVMDQVVEKRAKKKKKDKDKKKRKKKGKKKSKD